MHFKTISMHFKTDTLSNLKPLNYFQKQRQTTQCNKLDLEWLSLGTVSKAVTVLESIH